MLIYKILHCCEACSAASAGHSMLQSMRNAAGGNATSRRPTRLGKGNSRRHCHRGVSHQSVTMLNLQTSFIEAISLLYVGILDPVIQSCSLLLVQRSPRL